MLFVPCFRSLCIIQRQELYKAVSSLR